MQSSFAHRCALPLLAVGIFVVAGCGSSTVTGSSGNSTPVATSTRSVSATPSPTSLNAYCNLVGVADVTRITGFTVTQVLLSPNPTAPQINCGYAAGASSASVVLVIGYIVNADAGTAHTLLAQALQHSTSVGDVVTSLSGIGDEAYAVVEHGNNGLIARKGTIVFEISGQSPHNPAPDAVTQLAQLIASKL